MNPTRYYEVRREIDAILDDTTLPRYLQVSRIIDLFDTQGSVNKVDFWPDDAPIVTEEKTSKTDKPPRPKKKAARTKRAKTTKSRR